jgi:2-iminobutanoate/2-iminopropanoate deaminase
MTFILGRMAARHRINKLDQGEVKIRRSESHAKLIVLLALALAGCATVHDEARLRSVAVEGAPKAVGPYAQGIVAGGFLYTAGELPLDPSTGHLVSGDMGVQANRVLDNLEAILKGGGCSLHDVVKVTVFMTDLSDFAKLNDVMAARFGEHHPARTTVQVSKLPLGASLEMDAVASVGR